MARAKIYRITLCEEFRLIERRENEVNVVWKGAHLLLFFLAFVFGSFCTFCFHMLMYLFDEKCVLFPKLLSLTSLRHNVIYEFIPEEKERVDMLPVDFVSTQWVEKSACYLPTYVPLVSGIFGLVWTTMFLMCSTGSRTLTGLQRPWRVVPPVFIFSLAMGGLCIYSSTMTHYGLQELCVKLGEITGSSTCSYTVNVATLAYERRIRGVFQATRLTIISAWLHTGCWLLSALLALARVLLAVDFQLVRVSVDLIGDLDRMLEAHEEQLRSISPGPGSIGKNMYISSSDSSTEIRFQNTGYDTPDSMTNDIANLSTKHDALFFAGEQPRQHTSELSLVPEERSKLAKILAYQSVPRDKQFIVEILYNLIDKLDLDSKNIPKASTALSLTPSSSMIMLKGPKPITRQYGRQAITSKAQELDADSYESVDVQQAEELAKEIKRNFQEKLHEKWSSNPDPTTTAGTSKKRGHIAFESTMNIDTEMKRALDDKLAEALDDIDSDEEPAKIRIKTNLKNNGTQTEQQKEDVKKNKQVTISESVSTFNSLPYAESHDSKKDKDMQTDKEKQD